MALKHAPRIVTDGLVLALDAANPKSYPGSGTTWKNLVDGDSTFTLTNSPAYSDKVFTFDGINDYVVSSTSNFLKWENWDKLSFSITFNHTSATGASGNRQYIFDFRSSGGANGLLALFVDGVSSTPELTLAYNTVGTSWEEPTLTTYNFNKWITYTCTFDKTTSSNNIRHYINGVNVFNRSLTANSTTTNGDGNIWIGRYSQNTGYRFNGKIAQFYASVNTILSAEEVLQNYNATKSRFYDI